MKEKTKQILRYVACGLGGLALGIGLLGGLSMCATSSKKTTESVNTILTTDKVKHNLQGTTANGYTKLTFWLPSTEHILADNEYNYRVFSVDTSNYNLTLTESNFHLPLQDGYANVTSLIHELQSEYKPVTGNALNLLEIEGCNKPRADISVCYWTYISFLGKSNPLLKTIPFILLNNTNKLKWSIDAWAESAWYSQPNYILNYEPNQTCMGSETPLPNGTHLTFQDVESYYKELGYQDGYSAGNSAGYSSGYADGHTAGYSDGHTAGYSEGYEDGNQEGYDNGYQDGNEHGQAQGYEDGYNDGLTDGLEYGQEFTTYQIKTQDNNGGTYWPSYGWDINNNAPAGMYGDFTSSTYQIANLLQYKTEDNDLHLIYLMLPIEGAITGNEYFGHCYIYQYNQTDSTLEDTVANGLMYYQAAADHYNWDYAHIFWTSGGTRNINYGKVTGIYNDPLRKGYIQLSGQITDQNVYDTGYQAGLLAGQQNSNMNNVFSLFTGAFDACASFFNLRIFGFLPLYWFFLAPLFIALITLLLRMVKH